MPIFKINDIRIHKVNVSDSGAYYNDIKLKKGDVVHIRCDRCGVSDSFKYRSLKHFSEIRHSGGKTLCTKCLRKQTNIEKYGVENLSQSKEIQNKIKENSLKKYGTEHFLSSKEVRDKIDKTNEEKYGTKDLLQSEEIKEKIKKTMVKKYGVEYSLQSNEIKSKFQKSMMKRYGSQQAMHSQELKERRRINMQSRIKDKIFDFEHITPLFKKEDFTDINHFYRWRCNSCKTVFEDHLNYGHIPRCPKCFPKKIRINRKKNEIIFWLKNSLNIKNVVEDDKTIIAPNVITIMLPDYHVGINIISLYWDSEAQGKSKSFQLKKSSMAASQDIQLLSIFEDEWVNKQDIIKSIIKRKLGLLGKTISTDSCFVEEITNQDARLFYQKNHIQGHANCQFNYGLFDQREGLVACMSTSKPRFNHSYSWEVVRFAVRLNINVIGAPKMMLDYFRKDHEGSIIAYGDCRYFESKIYEDAGMKHISRSEPNYFYTDYLKRHNRLKYQKNKLHQKLKIYDEDLTEWQNMQMNGFDRIWDCGSNVFTLD
jgi:hypothetical protein